MNYTSNLFAKGDPEKLYECFCSEETSFDRSSFTVKKVDNGIEFNIKATDAVALRSTFNSISQLLIVFEGAGKKK